MAGRVGRRRLVDGARRGAFVSSSSCGSTGNAARGWRSILLLHGRRRAGLLLHGWWRASLLIRLLSEALLSILLRRVARDRADRVLTVRKVGIRGALLLLRGVVGTGGAGRGRVGGVGGIRRIAVL